jgi:hypothetical protein
MCRLCDELDRMNRRLKGGASVTNRNCSTCTYAVRTLGAQECRRFPPHPRQGWPITYGDGGWCAEWSPPLVQGGQGRSARDVRLDAALVGLTCVAALALLLLAVIVYVL